MENQSETNVSEEIVGTVLLTEESEQNTATDLHKRAPRKIKPFPSYSIEEAIKVAFAIAENNAGNPWGSKQVAEAIGIGQKSSNFQYLVAASRDYGFTTGTNRSKTIELTTLGRKVVFPVDVVQESTAYKKAFENIDLFKKVFEYYKRGGIPEKKFFCNTLQEHFDLIPDFHDEFIDVYRKNLTFIQKKTAECPSIPKENLEQTAVDENEESDVVPSAIRSLFVIMPFSEKTGVYPEGYFDEVFNSLIVPAASQAGYNAQTANQQGSDIIHKTIVSNIYNAEMILADLTEHNPNVLFELGLAIAFKKKVAIIRAKGTKAIFDVDNSMRVLDYNPNLWKSTLDMDVEKLAKHIEVTANSNETSYLDIFLAK